MCGMCGLVLLFKVRLKCFFGYKSLYCKSLYCIRIRQHMHHKAVLASIESSETQISTVQEEQ